MPAAAASYLPPRAVATPRRSRLPRKDYAIPIFVDLISHRGRPPPNEAVRKATIR